MKRTLGVCYYPEHWPKNLWKEDAKRMAEAGLYWVRIGEFAWSKMEPTPGELKFEWLDEFFIVSFFYLMQIIKIKIILKFNYIL